jgi:mono/diheme cytochrome c family protein
VLKLHIVVRAMLAVMVILCAGMAGAQDSAPTDKASVGGGRQLFLAKCAACHGPNGKAEVEAMANAADLTRPQFFTCGSGDTQIFNSIANGVGNGMPPFKRELTDPDIWKIIAFIRSIAARAPATAAP